jgi:dipeptidyl aminopeptidase/acylaminoacyl peptidase
MTQLFGSITFLQHFDPAKRYPAVISVYAGPDAPGFVAERFAMPNGNWGPNGSVTIAVHTRASQGSAMSYVNHLRGDLPICYGTIDNNVHNANSMQLMNALQAAGKHFVVQVGPDEGHPPISLERAQEFLLHSLILKAKYGVVY